MLYEDKRYVISWRTTNRLFVIQIIIDISLCRHLLLNYKKECPNILNWKMIGRVSLITDRLKTRAIARLFCYSYKNRNKL